MEETAISPSHAPLSRDDSHNDNFDRFTRGVVLDTASGSAEYSRSPHWTSLDYQCEDGQTVGDAVIQHGGSNSMTWYKVKLDKQELARYPSQNLIRRLRALMRATGLTGARVFATRQRNGEVCLYISPRAANRKQRGPHTQKSADLCLFPGTRRRRVSSPWFLHSTPDTGRATTTEERR
jgi:hypothetical protein